VSIPITHPAVIDAYARGLVVDRTPGPVAKKKRKWNNVPTVVDGVRYDSKKEARHGQLLAAMERDGLIRDLRRQVRYPITVNGVLIGHYVADFAFLDFTGKLVVQDVKSEATKRIPLYQWKKRLMKAVHGITIQEV
jgi:hypothetical protein